MRVLFFAVVLSSSVSFACPDLSGTYSCVRDGKNEQAFEYTFSFAPKEKLYVGSITKKNGNTHMMKFSTTGEWIPSKDVPRASKNAGTRGVCAAESFTSYFRADLIDRDGAIVPHTSETKYFKEGKILIEETKEVTHLPQKSPLETFKKMVCTPITNKLVK